MKSMRPPLAAIFFMTYFHRARGGPWPPWPPLDPLLHFDKMEKMAERIHVRRKSKHVFEFLSHLHHMNTPWASILTSVGNGSDLFITACQQSYGKIMFLHVSVNLFTGVVYDVTSCLSVCSQGWCIMSLPVWSQREEEVWYQRHRRLVPEAQTIGPRGTDDWSERRGMVPEADMVP